MPGRTAGLLGAELSAVIFEGLAARTHDGKRASLAIVDEHGIVIEAGPQVAKEAWGVMLACYRKFLEGNGHIRVHSRPPGPPH
jgi:hypothetical protein